MINFLIQLKYVPILMMWQLQVLYTVLKKWDVLGQLIENLLLIAVHK